MVYLVLLLLLSSLYITKAFPFKIAIRLTSHNTVVNLSLAHSSAFIGTLYNLLTQFSESKPVYLLQKVLPQEKALL